MKNPYEDCPRFQNCSVNVCPLDPLMNEKVALPEDAKCSAQIGTRLEIVKQYPDVSFQFQGLTSKENSKHKRSLAAHGAGLL